MRCNAAVTATKPAGVNFFKRWTKCSHIDVSAAFRKQTEQLMYRVFAINADGTSIGSNEIRVDSPES
jgi:hypothetical protein